MSPNSHPHAAGQARHRRRPPLLGKQRIWIRFQAEGDWRKLAWGIHDNLPYSSLVFFPKFWAFDINWHERPERRIDSFVTPKGCLTKPGMPNHGGSPEEEWRGIVP